MAKKKSVSGKDAKPKATAANPATPVAPAPDASNARMAPSAPLASAGRPAFRRPQSLNFAGVGRNDICPCGSGKRFKNCHGH
jgi:preprotein translocase subunit SecA